MSRLQVHEITIWYVTQQILSAPVSMDLRKRTTCECSPQQGTWIQPTPTAAATTATASARPQMMTALVCTFSQVWHCLVSPR